MFHIAKCAAVNLRGADLAQSRQMFGCSVPLVVGQSVAGVLAVQPAHDLVAGDLGDDGGGRYRDGDLVAAREGQLPNTVRERQRGAVNEDAIHAVTQRVEGSQHGLTGCSGDALGINAACGRHGEANGGVLQDELCQAFSFGRAEFLGIVNIIEPCQRLGGEDDGSRGDGACERAAPASSMPAIVRAPCKSNSRS